MHVDQGSGGGKWRLWRYGPLAVWLCAIITGLVLPLKILSLGYIPQDDAMRHVAKVISGKPWSEILVLREGFTGDGHPGWHTILGALHHGLHWDAEGLMTFSVCALFVLVWLAWLMFQKRPEATMLAIFLGSVTATATFSRFFFGRPFIFVMAIYLILFHLWTSPQKPAPLRFVLSTLLISLSVWVHGSWYLFGLVVAAFALVGEWRKALMLAGCWLVGTVLGASLTGHPFGYVRETLLHLINCFDGRPLERMLVTELRSDPGDLVFVVVIALMLLWRQARGEWRREVIFNPVFALAVLGWLLGIKVSRFWTDWGFPAALLWLAKECGEVLEARLDRRSIQAVLLAGFAAGGVYVATTRDLGNRWTSNLTVEYLDAENPDLTGWLPEKGGIVYSSDMEVFFKTFYKNPHAEWRYLLGYEPGLMPPEDLAILRKIQWNWFASKAYDPWVRKMRPQDRMILLQGANFAPQIKGLEWYYAATDTWIGRLPRQSPAAGSRR